MKRVRIQVFKKSQLEQWVKEKGFDQVCKEEEDRRCASDLMYCIFRRPEQCIPTLLPRLIELIEKKYAPDLTRSRIYTDTITRLLNNGADLKIRVFFTLLIISREEEAQSVIRSAYREGSLWGHKSSTRFQQVYLPILCAIINQAFSEPFGEVNIVDIVTWVVTEAEQMYMKK